MALTQTQRRTPSPDQADDARARIVERKLDGWITGTGTDFDSVVIAGGNGITSHAFAARLAREPRFAGKIVLAAPPKQESRRLIGGVSLGAYAADFLSYAVGLGHTEPVAFRDGAFPSYFLKAPGTTKFHPIVLERGITHDATFEDWAELAYAPAGDAAMSLRNFRKDMRINLLNLQGNIVLSYMVYRCWVSEYQSLPELDASANAVAIQTLKLENEGWERDYEVTKPTEPSFTEPAN